MENMYITETNGVKCLSSNSHSQCKMLLKYFHFEANGIKLLSVWTDCCTLYWLLYIVFYKFIIRRYTVDPKHHNLLLCKIQYITNWPDFPCKPFKTKICLMLFYWNAIMRQKYMYVILTGCLVVLITLSQLTANLF